MYKVGYYVYAFLKILKSAMCYRIYASKSYYSEWNKSSKHYKSYIYKGSEKTWMK